MHTPRGITPPAPGLEREEPELRREEDIPKDDQPAGGSERGSAREERARPDSDRK